MKNLKEIFNLFVSVDDPNPIINAPFELNGTVFATDRHVMIWCDKSVCGFEVSNAHGSLKAAASIIPEVNCNHVLKLEKQIFEDLKTEVEYKVDGEDVKCRTCDGDGTVMWEFESYEREDDCPVCDGDGITSEAKKIPTGFKTFPIANVKLNQTYFQVKLFYKLIQVSEFLNEPVYLISYNETPSKAAVFEIGHVRVLIMPTLFDTETGVVLTINTH